MRNTEIPKTIAVKRAFDMLFSLLLIVLSSPLWALFFTAIFIEHTFLGKPFDPLVYSETRISRGKRFSIYKFNIFDQRKIDRMRNAGEFIHTKELEHNGKLILFGKFLKQIYMDELPQLWNVFTGDMSVVGPRPLNLEVYKSLEEKCYPAVGLLRGGMTGPVQSYKGADSLAARDLDNEYLLQYRTRSGLSMVLYDLRIIGRTLKVIIRAKGV